MVDYKHTDDFDLKVESGDFIQEESTQQHQKCLLLLEKGELRQYPKTGVGVRTFILDDQPGNIYGEIQVQFDADGMNVKKLVVDADGKIDVLAIYR